jgi:hypothetical protein
MTRADFYARLRGGSWRTARSDKRCDHRDSYGMRCQCFILEGSRYFDTNQQDPHSKNAHITVRLCESCANEEIE